MCSLRSADVFNSSLHVLQVKTLTPDSSLRCSSKCSESWLWRTNSSPHSAHIRFCKRKPKTYWQKCDQTHLVSHQNYGLTSSFSCNIMWDLRLAMRENFLWQTGHEKSEVLCVDLWRVRLNSTLKLFVHLSHRWVCKWGREGINILTTLITTLTMPWSRHAS